MAIGLQEEVSQTWKTEAQIQVEGKQTPFLEDRGREQQCHIRKEYVGWKLIWLYLEAIYLRETNK